MPVLNQINASKAEVSTGDITVSSSADTQGSITEQVEARNTDFNFPAGALRVQIKNLGGAQNSSFATITINGVGLEPGSEQFEREAVRDHSTNPPTFKKLPAYAIITNGAWVEGLGEY